MTLEQLFDDFVLLEDWEDRYRHLIDLGRAMPSLESSEKIPANKVEVAGWSFHHPGGE